MPTVTLTESAKLALNELVAGVIENVITVNKMFHVLPFDGIDGNALAYNRENVLGDVEAMAVGELITAKNPATFTNLTSGLITILGDAEVNGLIQNTRSDDGNDQTAVQIASKAKNCGRQFQQMLINGDGTSQSFLGLLNLCASGQTIVPTGSYSASTQTGEVASANGCDPLTFIVLDQLLSLITDKDGTVDYFAMNQRTINSYLNLLRNLGGARIDETIAITDNVEVPAYRGTPIFRNDYIPINQTYSSGATNTTVFAGTFDDGSRQHGIAGLTASNASGIHVVDVGEKELTDDHIWRVKWYCGLALFSEKGLAMAEGILN